MTVQSVFQPMLIVEDDGETRRVSFDFRDSYSETVTVGVDAPDSSDPQKHADFLDEIIGLGNPPATQLRRLADFIEVQEAQGSPFMLGQYEAESVCAYCGQVIWLFDKAPARFAYGKGQGWATDCCSDINHDFECPARESSARWPDGKPHEPRGSSDVGQ